jgi:hypothetical protein
MAEAGIMKTTTLNIKNSYPLLRFGPIEDRRLFRILHCVLTLNELPDDITQQEKDSILYHLIEPYIDNDGSYSYYLTDFGEAFMCEFLFRKYDHTPCFQPT